MIGCIYRATRIAVLVPSAADLSIFFKDGVRDTEFAKLDSGAQPRGASADDCDVNIVCLSARLHLVMSGRLRKIQHMLIADLQAHLLKQHWHVGFRDLFTHGCAHHFLDDLAGRLRHARRAPLAHFNHTGSHTVANVARELWRD